MLSHPSRVAIVSAAVIGCLSSQVSAQTSRLPLVVDQASIAYDARLPGPGRNVLTIELHNNGAKTITAWAYWMELRLSDGTNRRVPRFVDTLPATSPSQFFVAPGGRRTETDFPPSVSPATVADISVQVEAVIFEDATAAGDESLLAHMFAGRLEHRQAWNGMSEILSVARARYSDPLEVLEKVNADSQAAGSKPSTAVREVQQRARAGIRSTQPQAAQTALNALVQFVTSKRELYQAQAVRVSIRSK